MLKLKLKLKLQLLGELRAKLAYSKYCRYGVRTTERGGACFYGGAYWYAFSPVLFIPVVMYAFFLFV